MHLRSRKLGIRLTSAILVAMLSLASARAVVPGLCATQSALEARSDSGEVVCCEHTGLPIPGGVPVVRADNDVDCALCQLATALVKPSSVIFLEVAAVHAIADEQPLDTLALADSLDRAHAGRAPPATSLV